MIETALEQDNNKKSRTGRNRKAMQNIRYVARFYAKGRSASACMAEIIEILEKFKPEESGDE